jgi:hypothetical protein
MDTYIRHRHQGWTAAAMIWNAAVAIGLVVALLWPIVSRPG